MFAPLPNALTSFAVSVVNLFPASPFSVLDGIVKKRKAHVEYRDNSELTAERAYSLEHHKIGKAGQTLAGSDERQIIFNFQDFGRKEGNTWKTFFSQKRKLAYNIAHHVVGSDAGQADQEPGEG